MTRDILYIESALPDILIYTVDGKVYRTKGKISAFTRELEHYGFVSADASNLVNLAYVKRLEEAKKVILGSENGLEYAVDVSRRKRKSLEQAMKQFQLGRMY